MIDKKNYAIKTVLAQGTIDFKRHKDVIAYFNKEYVATDKFDRERGRKLGTSNRLEKRVIMTISSLVQNLR